MKRNKNSYRNIFGWLMILLLTVGCQQENGSILNPNDDLAAPNPHGQFLETAQGKFELVRIDQQFQTKSPIESLPDTSFTKVRFVEADKGGMILLGHWAYGYSSIIFDKGALPKSDSIHFSWVPQGSFDGTLSGMEFGLLGTQFNGTVMVNLSYKNADLGGIDEKKLKVAFLNEKTGQWEIQVTSINISLKTVTVYLKRFSRYALVHG